ncbi:MAG: RHS repeat-associated core domain-containing protein [Bdellovibrionota bacterium]
MKSLTMLFATLFLMFTHAEADNSPSQRGGVLINVSADRKAVKSGDVVKFSGIIKVLDKDKDHGHHKGKDEDDHKKTLLQIFQKDGVGIVGTFPSEAVDISNSLELTSTEEDEIKFSFTASSVNANSVNQLSIKVFNNHKNKELLMRLAQIKAKIDRRILALQQLKHKSKNENWSAAAIAYINKKTEVLNQLSQQIQDNLNKNENLLAENRYALQVDNLTSSSSQISTIMNKYRFAVTSEIGTAIEGTSTKINAAVTNLRKSSSEDNDDDDDLKAAQFVFNGVALYTSAAQNLSNGESISYTYTIDRLLPINSNEFSVALYHVEKNKLKKRIGWVVQKIPVVPDTINPGWLVSSSPSSVSGTLYVQALDYVNLHAQDLLGRIDAGSFVANLTGSLVSSENVNQDVSLKFSKLKIGDGWEYAFSGDLNPLQEGLYALEANIKDLSKNEASPHKIDFRIDRTVPKISLGIPNSSLTNQLTYQASIGIEDLSPTTTKVYVNEVLQLITPSVFFTTTLNLNKEGANLVKVVSEDMAGNLTISDIKTIIRDTTPPVLTFVSPVQGDPVDGFYFQVSLSANEPVVSAKLNEQAILISGETQSLVTQYSTVVEGNTTLNVQATDKAGNIGQSSITVLAISRPLNQSLIGLYVDEPNNKIIVKGAVGATRPNYSVNVSRGFFSSETIIADSKGSFMVSMQPSTAYKVSVYDDRKNETVSYSYELDADNDIMLSGVVRDTDDFPLVHAEVSITGTPLVTYTDSNGVFSFLKSNFPGKKITGDQQLLIDGTNVILSPAATPRKFSKTAVSITIGVRQSNILQTPIYLAPTYLDGTGTLITAQGGGVVIDIHASGVALNIPAGAAQFPNGESESVISLQTIPADRATISVPKWARPNTVVALEPSGTTFSEPVELTLPNVNEFPPTAELVVMLMNSKTGRWEIGGAAAITRNGQSIVTKPNQGIRHFSLAYATIIGPNIRQIGAQDRPGADTFNGALSAQIELPSFKVLGSSFVPKLFYNSSWAKPAALVTNLFDFSNTKVSVNAPTQVGSRVESYDVDLINCNWQIKFETNANAFDDIENLPSYCSKDPKTFYSNMQYETKYTDVSSQIQPQRVEASFKTGTVTTEKEVFNNIPHMATISFGVELKKDIGSSNYFDSGIYPYQAHYDIYFKELVMGTYTTEYWNETMDAKTTAPAQFEQLSPEKVFGQDLTDSLFVQNYRNSEAGTGWKIGGFQKIANPSSNKIMLEESNGAISSYAINDTIQTVIDVASQGGEIKNGVALNAWPNIAVPSSQNSNEIFNLEFSSSGINKSSIGTNYAVSGYLKGYDFYNYTEQTNCRAEWFCQSRTGSLEFYRNAWTCFIDSQTYYHATYNGSTFYCPPTIGTYRVVLPFRGTNLCEVLDGGSYPANFGTVCDSTPKSSCSTHTSNYEIKSKPVSMLNLNGRIIGVDASRHSVFDMQNGSANRVLGAQVSPPIFFNNYQTQSETQSGAMSAHCNSNGDFNCSSQTRTQTMLSGSNQCGTIDPNPSEVPYSGHDTISNGFQTLNAPMAIIAGAGEDAVVIADYGFHKVRWLNTVTGATGVIAGNGQTGDIGNGGPASEASINHPKGLAYDSIGNLYISSESGYIRKVDTNGYISTISGDPINGVLANESKAREVYFNKPYGLVIDQLNNYLYVADTGNNRVVRINLNTNQATTVAGNGVAGSHGDGKAALEASLNAPTQLGLDENNNLLIADSGNNKIRRVTFQNKEGAILAFLPTAKDHSILQRVEDGTWVRTYRDGGRIYFNSLGYQISSVDNASRIVQYQYDGQNRLTEIKMASGEALTYTYSGNRLSRITDPAGRATEFSYDFSNNLKAVHYPDQSSKKFEYNSDGLMTAEIDQKDAKREYLYNAHSRLEKVLLPESTPAVVLKDSGSENLDNFKDAVTKPQQLGTGTEKLSESISDPSGNTTVLAKDFQGYISTIVDARGRKTTVKRDIEGRAIETTDVDGSITQSTYDPTYGDIIKTRNVSLDIETQTQFNIYGQVISQTDPFGKVSQKQYDAKKQLIKEIAPDGKYASYEYSPIGLVVKKSVYSAANELKNQISYEYNSKGQLVKQTDFNNKFSSYTYDLAGNILTSTSNINGNTQSVTSYEFDSMNRLKKVTSPKAEVTEYSYSPLGELLQIKDPNQKITSFEYNLKGQLIKKTDPAGLVYEMTYDINGNLLTEKDPANQLKQYTYNEVNKITKVQTADDIILYNYNIKDEVIGLTNNTAAIDYQRDLKQRITQEVVTGNSLNYPAHMLNVEYNKLDQRTLLQSNFQNISYEFNQSNDQLSGISSSATGNYNFYFDDASRLSAIVRPGSRTEYTFDTGSSLERIAHISNNVIKSSHEYSYDLRNYITQKRSTAGVLDYSYDSNGQLISANKAADNTQNESFTYDALGNRLTYNGVASTFDNSGQRIQDDGQFTYVFDANGNIIYKSNKQNGISYAFEYSALNQLKKATVTSSPLGGTVLKVLEYKYDPAGRRILRQITDNVDSSKSKTQKFFYDGDNILAEVDAINNLTVSYTHSPLRADDVLGAKFTSSAVTNGLATSAGNVYYLKDHLNTVNEITNASGEIIQKMDYSAYGVLRSVKDSTGNEVGFENAPVRSSFTYTGREFEPELGMYYYRARYYDPNSGRFLQQDPDPGKLASPNTFLSKYIYAANNPAMLSDPSGMSWFTDVVDAVLGARHQVFANLGAAFDNLVKDKTFQIIAVIIAAALIGPAVAGLFTLTGWTAVGVSAVVGGLVGGISYVGLGLGTFAEGFALGALAGGLAGYSGKLYGGSNPMFNLYNSTVQVQLDLIKKYGWAYLYDLSLPGTPGHLTWGGSLLVYIISQSKRPKKDENE